MEPKAEEWIIGITGASGIRYARRLLQVLPPLIKHTHVVCSESALRVLKDEEGIAVSSSGLDSHVLCGVSHENVTVHNPRDIGARIASGSARMRGMVVVPCSMSSLAAIATGAGTHLVHRAADVALKERRTLILVPRETPLSAIHLQNMLTLAGAGAHIVPAMPGFYHNPKTIDDIVDHLVMKILDLMDIPNNMVARWRQPTAS
jgi:4-hydroxy-3-polyprenylbenzoate decarboxylase